MIHLHDAIRQLSPSVVTIHGDLAYDAQNNEVAYDKSAAEARFAELQATEISAQQAAVAAKESAQAKLAALGLTPAEVSAIIGA